jgi:hypothetical protein
MKKLLALALLLLPAAALLASGCGDSCTNKGTSVKRTNQATSCDVAAASFTVNVTPACQSCADDAPKCDISPVPTGGAQLDVQVRECDSNRGCSGSSCAFGAVACGYTANWSGPGTLYFLINGAPVPFTVNVGSGSATTCTL